MIYCTSIECLTLPSSYLQGHVIAFDKSQQKIDKIVKTAENWGLTNIKAFVFDGTKAVQENSESSSSANSS